MNNIDIIMEGGRKSTNFVNVKLLQDDASHWYIVPNDEADEFIQLINYICDHEDDDGIGNKIVEFESKFSKYRIGGDINNYQLCISQEELNRLTT